MDGGGNQRVVPDSRSWESSARHDPCTTPYGPARAGHTQEGRTPANLPPASASEIRGDRQFFAVHRDVNGGEVGPLWNHLSGKWQIAELVAAKVGAYGADLPLRRQGDVDELQRTPAVAVVKLEGDSCGPQIGGFVRSRDIAVYELPAEYLQAGASSRAIRQTWRKRSSMPPTPGSPYVRA